MPARYGWGFGIATFDKVRAHRLPCAAWLPTVTSQGSRLQAPGRRLVADRPIRPSMLAVDLHLLAYAALPLEPRSRTLGDM
jgi:hypothetical protein